MFHFWVIRKKRSFFLIGNDTDYKKKSHWSSKPFECTWFFSEQFARETAQKIANELNEKIELIEYGRK